ncbi:class I SAM-dependent methyltransferase [Opitutus sp. ER46]|uniref:class I SAM-dependent methyltransferase n=1 Tax=Opitutus sp. ER46 TaxID=2161864 RepID=UPI000D2F9E59|nr:class I SAM-dependent methyltransferase [Opitutus sp. ER46]PTX91111.1 hypothetical protein DB354_20975 [Opitutus sp. ER46]
MPDEKGLFQTTGKSWSERASLGELDAVLTGCGNHGRNAYLHATQLWAARYIERCLPGPSVVVDFGCGTGRFLRFFAGRGHQVLGTEITPEMLEQLRQLGLPSGSTTTLTDGIHIPVAPASVDLIWVCSVLRYSLNVPTPVYADIAREMHRALRPGGMVANVEMYVEQPASDFTRDFEAAGFTTKIQRVINRHSGRIERFVQRRRLPFASIRLIARWTARARFHFDRAASARPGIRDYFFVWRKS